MSPDSGNAPLVSVVVPAYNASKYIQEALDSVFSSTFTNYEVIVINDGSSDTAELGQVLESYGSRVVYLSQPNGGPGAARNAGILRSRGRFIAFLDSDDIWYPEFLAKQVESLERDSLDLVCADVVVFGEIPGKEYSLMSVTPCSSPTFENLLGGRSHIVTSSTVARRQAILDAGLFDVNFWRCEDYDLWLRMAFRGCRFGYRTEALARHRETTGSLGSDERRMARSKIAVLTKFLGLCTSESLRSIAQGRISEVQAELALLSAKWRLLEHDYSETAKNLDLAIAHLKQSRSHLRLAKTRIGLALFRLAPGLLRRIVQWRAEGRS